MTRFMSSSRKLLEKSYGLSEGDYDWMNSRNICWICGEPPSEDRKLAIDHEHASGIVRGLLCHRCNQALGLFKDSEQNLERALDYLKRQYSAFSDYCDSCDDSYIYSPLYGEFQYPDGSVQWRYKCVAGHKWTTTYATKGMLPSIPIWMENM